MFVEVECVVVAQVRSVATESVVSILELFFRWLKKVFRLFAVELRFIATMNAAFGIEVKVVKLFDNKTETLEEERGDKGERISTSG